MLLLIVNIVSFWAKVYCSWYLKLKINTSPLICCFNNFPILFIYWKIITFYLTLQSKLHNYDRVISILFSLIKILFIPLKVNYNSANLRKFTEIPLSSLTLNVNKT